MSEIKSIWKYHQISSPEQQQIDWANSIKQICTVKTIPEILYTIDQTESAGLENFLDLNFFKQNIAPMWEDPNNIHGGRIIAEFPLSMKDKLHELWKRTVVFCALEPFHGINGCVYTEKASYRICVWISDPSNADDIKAAWKHVLDCDDVSFAFTIHSERTDGSRLKKRGGFSKNFNKN